MSLRGDLREAGISEENLSAVERVVKGYIADEYVPKARFDEVYNNNKELQKMVDSGNAEMKSWEDRYKELEGTVEPLKKQLEQTEMDWSQRYLDLEESHRQAEEDRLMLDNYNTRLSAARSYIGDTAYDSDMVLSLIDFDSLDIQDGKVMGVDKAVDTLRKERPFLFKHEEVTSTAPTSAPSAGAGTINFGEALAKKAAESDALTQAAAEKYFK